MKDNQNNKQLYWLVFYDEILYQSYRTLAFLLSIAKDDSLNYYRRVKKILKVFKEYHKSFNEYNDWFMSNYYFRLDYAFDFDVKKPDYYKSYYRGTMEIKVWLN